MSLRLTVLLLLLAAALVYMGTLSEVKLGLYRAQAEYFHSLFVYWGPAGALWRIPVFPGGYLIGGLLLLNLIAAHAGRLKFTRKKFGLWIIHAGLILLIVGQLAADLFAVESHLHLRQGQTKNYSESDRRSELAITEVNGKGAGTVVTIPENLLAKQGEIHNQHLPFEVKVKTFFPNSSLVESAAPGYRHSGADAGAGAGSLWWKQQPRETATDRRDMPSALVELSTAQGTLGTWLVSDWLQQPQAFNIGGNTYQLQLRPERFYLPFNLKLLQFRHQVYDGTDIPKSFSSRLELSRPDTGEHRQVLVYMNHPLRYGGKTFYQASYDTDNQGTILQVVKNPGWLAPYLACGLIGTGMMVQFLSHLVPFLRKRRAR